MLWGGISDVSTQDLAAIRNKTSGIKDHIFNITTGAQTAPQAAPSSANVYTSYTPAVTTTGSKMPWLFAGIAAVGLLYFFEKKK